MAVFSCRGQSVLFVHTPKCAGTSVTTVLEALGEKRFDDRIRIGRHAVRPRHLPREALERIFLPEMFDYSFMMVRNPVERVLSEYRYQCRKAFPRWQAILGFDRWLALSLARAASDPWYRENHFRPQTDFRVFDCDVFRVEEGLAPLVAKLAEITGMDMPAVTEHRNRTEARDIRMTSRSLDLILRTYRADFEAFGYPSAVQDYHSLLR